MKAEIRVAKWEKEYPNKFDPNKPLQLHRIVYINENLEEVVGFYSSVKKDQSYFKVGETVEFTTEEMKSGKNTWLKIKPIKQNFQSNYGRAVKKEQSRYSGFAMAYAKDLVVSGHIKIEDMYDEAQHMIDWMVTQDKNLAL